MKAVTTSGDRHAALGDVTLAGPEPGEVRVRIAAAGVCHSDLHVWRGDWDVPTPLVMGHEGSGTVTAVGEEADGLAVGDHVVLSWVPACGRCRQCLQGHPARCALVATVVAPGGVLYDGTSRLSREGDGGALHHYLGVSSFAEEAVVPASGAIPIRADAPLEAMSLIGCAIATGIGAVERTATVEPGSTVVIIGCGGVGLACLLGATLAGASRIIAADVVGSKLQLAGELGATDLVHAGKTDTVAAVRGLVDGGADYAFDAIGKTTTTEQAIAMLGLGGAAVVVGLPPTGSVAGFDPLVLAEADQRILGSNYGGVDPRRDFPRLVDLYMEGRLPVDRLISGRRPLAEAQSALEELERGTALRTLLVP
jgi:S-(hydroxymethyl)glutathione dehydrogenase/alcohol dehydrogenase